MSKKYLIVGAGFSGAVLARELVENLDCQVLVIDSREHLGGNCHTARDAASGVMIHEYGPHIFNTNHEDVWSYFTRFGTLRPFVNRVKAVNSRGVFGLPMNLLTINQFFGKAFNPSEAKEFVNSLGDQTITDPQSFEEQALRFIGADLYKAFFYGYTKKQWGCEPSELPASILKRLPIRFNYDDNYYNTKYQGIPEQGYTEIIKAILAVEGVEVRLGTAYNSELAADFDHVFFAGPIDAYFGYSLGRLRYRTVTFERIDAEGDYQGNAVINYTEESVPYTRVHEHKHFTPWESHERTVAFKEYSQATGPKDIPYYPLRRAEDMKLFNSYSTLAQEKNKITFTGRLGTYRYLDMDQVIGEALDLAKIVIENGREGKAVPTFGSQRGK